MARHKLTKADSIKGGENSKRLPLNEAWRDKLETKADGKEDTQLEELFQALMIESRNGNIQAIRETLNRVYGQAPQKIDAEVKGIQIAYTPKSAKDL